MRFRTARATIANARTVRPRRFTVRSDDLVGISCLKVIGLDARVLRDTGQHLGANFLAVVKCEDEICVSGAAKRAM
jgi:hypothetical protein